MEIVEVVESEVVEVVEVLGEEQLLMHNKKN